MPKCPFHNNHMDGAMNFTIRDEEVRSGIYGVPVVLLAEKHFRASKILPFWGRWRKRLACSEMCSSLGISRFPGKLLKRA